MKCFIYTLEADGTIPSYIVDGGYFPVPNGNPFPQNLNLVGIATDESAQEPFTSEAELLTYVQDNCESVISTITWQVIPKELLVATVWAKLAALGLTADEIAALK